jgi:hypothetical protein
MLSTPSPFINDKNDFTPLNDIKVVTPSDGTDLPGGTCRAMIFTGAGNVTFTTAAGNDVTIAISSGTTISAGNIYACY